MLELHHALRHQVRDMLPVQVSCTILDCYPIKPLPDSSPRQISGLTHRCIERFGRVGLGSTRTRAWFAATVARCVDFAVRRAEPSDSNAADAPAERSASGLFSDRE